MSAKVRDVMTPGPIGVQYRQSVADAARAMRDWGVGAVLVVREQALCGLVTDRDLAIRNRVHRRPGPRRSAPRTRMSAMCPTGRYA
jgi:signal-transduction protein with cAMP-binding, CBS, and nucleotidyltransferase domain